MRYAYPWRKVLQFTSQGVTERRFGPKIQAPQCRAQVVRIGDPWLQEVPVEPPSKTPPEARIGVRSQFHEAVVSQEHGSVMSTAPQLLITNLGNIVQTNPASSGLMGRYVNNNYIDVGPEAQITHNADLNAPSIGLTITNPKRC